MSVAAMCCGSWQLLCVRLVFAVQAPAAQSFSSNNLGLSAPEEACSRNVRASSTLKLGYVGILKRTVEQILLLCCNYV